MWGVVLHMRAHVRVGLPQGLQQVYDGGDGVHLPGTASAACAIVIVIAAVVAAPQQAAVASAAGAGRGCGHQKTRKRQGWVRESVQKVMGSWGHTTGEYQEQASNQYSTECSTLDARARAPGSCT